MSGLVEFLRARLDEDERVGLGCAMQLSDAKLRVVDHDTIAIGARRVLAEVEAKRRIIDEHAPRELLDMRGDGRGYPRTYCGRCNPANPLKRQLYPCRTLYLLALPYADHPDYQEEWQP